MDWQQYSSGSRFNSAVDFDYSLTVPFLPVSNPALCFEASNWDCRKTAMTSEQNNVKESDIFSKLALEIEAYSSSHIKSEFVQVDANTSLAIDSLACLNIHRSNEATDEFAVSNEDATAPSEDNSYCSLDQVKYLDVLPGCSQDNCDVKWPVCKKYPECPICTIDIEQLDDQGVRETHDEVSPSLKS